MVEWVASIDVWFFLFVNRDIANPFFDVFFVTITEARFWIIPAVIAAVLYVRAGKKQAVIMLALALVTIAITDPVAARIIKPLAGRLRPCHPDAFIEGGRFLIGMKRSFSFPSSHSMNIFGQAMLFTLCYPRRWVWFFSFAGLIGISRVYVGVHYPLDVAGGAVLGCTVGAAIFFSWRYVVNARQRRRVPDGSKKHEMSICER